MLYPFELRALGDLSVRFLPVQFYCTISRSRGRVHAQKHAERQRTVHRIQSRVSVAVGLEERDYSAVLLEQTSVRQSK